jgi:hypothetical protein
MANLLHPRCDRGKVQGMMALDRLAGDAYPELMALPSGLRPPPWEPQDTTAVEPLPVLDAAL